MFADSLLESAPHYEHRSAWTKLASMLLQCAGLAVALAIPLFHIERLQIIPPPPSIRMTPIGSPPAARVQAAPAYSATPTIISQIVPLIFSRHPATRSEEPAQEPGGVSLGPPCTANCANGVPIGNILNAGTVIISPPPPRAHPPRISDWQLGALVRKVVPEYPIIAKQIRLQGAVVLLATIGKDGRVQRVQPMSGPPMLVQPAMRAVEQWQYRPFVLNQEPIVVQTQITVNFVLNRE